MPDIYLIIVVILFSLAISDLIVGVSNDAVNFLNSSIGSGVASRRVIMIIASAGIFIGATFSSGMMEVARKGIFNPEFFFFEEIMIIFIAVMLTDIILLDLFNTFGMPTSTTVSIVFELLGAAVAVALLKVLHMGEGISQVSSYINSSSALTIISGILFSVGIAFTLGVIVQYLSRLLFSFHYQRRIKLVGAIWSGFALTALTYFLLIKGVKGASFISGEVVDWIKHNAVQIMGVSFVFWSVVMHILLRLNINILRIIVLFGTFSLAMAFAGNDLVNFIGVPIAGFESFLAWRDSGIDPGAYDMSVLKEPVRTKTYLLLIAGLIMIVTLWISRKARSVTETEINLGRQDEGLERFNPNLLSRALVRLGHGFGKGLYTYMPRAWINWAEGSFNRDDLEPVPGHDGKVPAFDLIRASVNLTVASIIISFATSLKLPLSTTYVTFMVAMGTSLADSAWGRDSAVYRVAGVLNVIGGWFLTALIAFTVSGLFATLIFSFGHWVIGALLFFAVFLLVRTFAYHRKQAKSKEKLDLLASHSLQLTADKVIGETSSNIAGSLAGLRSVYQGCIEGLLEQNRNTLKQADATVREMVRTNDAFRLQLFQLIRRMKEEESEGSKVYIAVYDFEQDMLQSIRFISSACRKHVSNVHNPLKGEQEEGLRQIGASVDNYLQRIQEALEAKDFSDASKLIDLKNSLLLQISRLIEVQFGGIRNHQYGSRNSLLYFNILLETKDLVAVAARFIKLYYRLQHTEDRERIF